MAYHPQDLFLVFGLVFVYPVAAHSRGQKVLAEGYSGLLVAQRGACIVEAFGASVHNRCYNLELD